jgi:hypothetical protein
MIWITGLTLIVLIVQAFVFWKQLDVMAMQKDIYGGQLRLQQQQMDWRRTEATGAFYRLAFDLVTELKKANQSASGDLVYADIDTPLRQELRNAGQVFAPLGDAVVQALTHLGGALEDYFDALHRYNMKPPLPRSVAPERDEVDALRARIGDDLDHAHMSIPSELRWKQTGGGRPVFHLLCSRPQVTEPEAPSS